MCGYNQDKDVDQWVLKVGLVGTAPLSESIMEEWKNYKRLFYQCEGNVERASLFENDGLLEGKSNLGLEIFGIERYERITARGKRVKIWELVEAGRVKAKDRIDLILGLTLNFAEYFRMRNTIMNIFRIYGVWREEGIELDVYMRAKKRKGGMLRKKLLGKKSKVYRDNDPRTIPSALTLWGEDGGRQHRELLEINFGLWGNSSFPLNFRVFLFKLVQGQLYLNNVLARIDNNRPQCTFCILKAERELLERNIGEDRPEYEYYLSLCSSETVNHLFWECCHVQPLIQKCYRWIRGLDWLNGNDRISKESFFRGELNLNRQLVICDVIWKHFVKFYIYECRQRRKIPQFGALRYELEGMLRNKKVRPQINGINMLYLN